MNETLKKQQLELLTDERAIAVYHTLCTACEGREGGMTDAEQMLIGDIAVEEQVKQSLIADIAKRGIGGEKKNGRQTYYQENKSLAQLRAYAEQQRKHLAELKLTPSSQKAANITVETDAFTDF